MKIEFTRALLKAALDGSLEKASMRPEPVFGFQVPTECPGVPSEILDPRATWPNPSDYDAQAGKLARLFRKNFVQFEDQAAKSIIDAGPRIG